LPPGCSKRELREAEQRHIDRLSTWSPAAGFNITPAIWDRDGPVQRAGRQALAVLTSTTQKGRWMRAKRAANPPPARLDAASVPPPYTPGFQPRRGRRGK
jgi:hypothetical protein